MNPVVITGAGGFVGASLYKYLGSYLGKHTEIIAIERPGGTVWRLKDIAPLKTAKVDLTSINEVASFIREVKPSIIINCAAYGAYPNQTDVDKIYSTNFDGVRNLLEASKNISGFRAFIQCGSSSEYGLNCSGPAENSYTQPDSHYAVSKVSATSLVQYYGKSLSFPAWVLRLYSLYGPLEETSRLIPTLLLHAKEKKLPPLVNPQISRDFLFIDDLCGAIGAVISKSDNLERGEIFNIGSGKKTTLSDIVDLTRDLFHITEKPQWGSMENRNWDRKEWFANPEKAKSVLGWHPSVSLRDGLMKTMDWINKNPETLLSSLKNSVLGKPV